MKLLLADDHELIRTGLIGLIQYKHPDWQILEAEDLREVDSQLQAHRDLDMLMLDIHLPGATGVSGLKKIRESWPSLCVVIISSSEDPALIQQSLELGAAGYIPKSTSNKIMDSALNLILSGGVYIPPAFMMGLGESDYPRPEAENTIDASLLTMNATSHTAATLDNHQLAVLRLMAQGYSNQEIASQLNLALQTIKNQTSRIFRLLKVKRRSEAIAIFRTALRQ